MFEIRMLPASEGDALWIVWGDLKKPYQMLVDMGTIQTGNLLYKEIEALKPEYRNFELAVVTHIDSDHIGGMLSCFVRRPPLAGLEIKDVWFNGFDHLDLTAQAPDTESLGANQGDELTQWLRDKGHWNLAFKKGAVVAPQSSPFPIFELSGGMKVTVLGPSCQRLDQLKPEWTKQLTRALLRARPAAPDDGVEAMGSHSAPRTRHRLKDLANMPEHQDPSIPNASSIVLMLEYSGCRVILTGDAWADDLERAIRKLSPEGCLEVDAFKVPHHASRFNITESLIKSLRCKTWLISTNGSGHHHPDDQAIAKIIYHSAIQPTELNFNVRSPWNEGWLSTERQKNLNYIAKHGDNALGLSLPLPTNVSFKLC